MAFDPPTQLALGPVAPLAAGEVGRVGVSIASLRDMRAWFDGLPLGEVMTSMTINAPAVMLLALSVLFSEEQGVPMERMRGTMQDDVVKEDAVRGTYIWPVAPSIRLTTDLLHLGVGILPAFNMISVRGYLIREVGATAAQEVAITLANAEAYVQASLEQGFIRDEIERSAYEAQREIEAGLRTVIGVNAYVPKGDAVEPEVQLLARGLEAERSAALRAHGAARDGVATRAALHDLRDGAAGEGALCPLLREALRAGATLGETSDVLREVWCVYAG